MIFTKDKFKTFISLCSFIKNYCDDLHIKNAKIHQKSNNSLFVIDCDLSSIFNDDISEFRLSNLQSKINMLSVFTDADNVSLTCDDKSYYIDDGISKLELRIPQDTILTNRYDEQLITSYNPETMILTYGLDNSILKKIKKISDITASQNIDFHISSEKVCAILTDTAKNVTMNVFELPYNGKLTITNPYTLRLNNVCFINIPPKTESNLAIYYDESSNITTTVVDIKFDNELYIDIYQRTRANRSM